LLTLTQFSRFSGRNLRSSLLLLSGPKNKGDLNLNNLLPSFKERRSKPVLFSFSIY
jgi:hypothetical protein